ncbi:hypothetical protein SAMN04488118_103155 [Epibacterium ulvae]|uniref:Uncharacterized protein n=1 Tax=Epibacterium ulvae TaxID=1156985 RepID=A0A1G5Q8F4_9RHOB|nr:hypothetical protein SAMN04488118_103155 [Epibacterium ulvae]
MPLDVDYSKFEKAQSVFLWSPGPDLPNPSPDAILAIPTDDRRATPNAMRFSEVV